MSFNFIRTTANQISEKLYFIRDTTNMFMLAKVIEAPGANYFVSHLDSWYLLIST